MTATHNWKKVLLSIFLVASLFIWMAFVLGAFARLISQVAPPLTGMGTGGSPESTEITWYNPTHYLRTSGYMWQSNYPKDAFDQLADNLPIILVLPSNKPGGPPFTQYACDELVSNSVGVALDVSCWENMDPVALPASRIIDGFERGGYAIGGTK